ncbi:type 1 glutamine amidotransferase [Kallotenue papyrolyticum]|uniref:type 1 glutamine amidotransferase n=1 Tax=Kallotenue papyrolyticum TaxID=1325125 RepID=UPI0004786317|nr:glutamine amidotransferase [Kallotenue papyrolyticum]
MAALRIAHLYPAQMNIYGDRGNVLTLVQRCRWRGIAVQVDGIAPGQRVDWTRYDLAFFGGGQDSGQALIAEDFVQRHGPEVRAAIADGLVMLAICGGYQLLGHYFLTHTGEKLPGIGALDCYTVGGTRRLIGNIVVAWSAGAGAAERIRPRAEALPAAPTPAYLVGFENHSGRTYLGAGVQPLGRVVRGYGNNGEDGTEGAVYQHAHGCYLHGSLLPKNPHFADHLLRLALQRRYGHAAALTPLDDTFEQQAHAAMVTRLL